MFRVVGDLDFPSLLSLPPGCLSASAASSPALFKSVQSETSPALAVRNADVRREEVLVEDGGLGRSVQQVRRGCAAVPPAEGTFSPLEAEADEF